LEFLVLKTPRLEDSKDPSGNSAAKIAFGQDEPYALEYLHLGKIAFKATELSVPY
jgi:hypothetical protein